MYATINKKSIILVFNDFILKSIKIFYYAIKIQIKITIQIHVHFIINSWIINAKISKLS